MISMLVGMAGVAIAFLGLGIEVVALLAVTSYAVRRHLPSPFLLQTVGFVVYVVGVALRALA